MTHCKQHRSPLSFATNGRGDVTAWCEKCERQAAGRCIDCGAPRLDVSKWDNLRCRTCYRERENNIIGRKRARTCRGPGCDAPVTPRSKRQYCSDKCQRAKKAKQRRDKIASSPALQERERRRKIAWRKSPNGRRSYVRHKRKGRLDGTQGYPTREAYLAAMKQQNAKRIEAHRAWARDNQRRYSEENPPRCATCNDVVPWNGRGRPRKYCPPCHPDPRRR